MVDLTSASVTDAYAKRGKGFLELIESMESKENWVLDNDPNVLRLVINWASDLTVDGYDFEDSESIEKFIKICAFLCTGRSMKLVSDAEAIWPGLAESLLIASNELIANNNISDMRPVIVFRDRIFTLYQANLLQRIFSPERIQGIKNAFTTSQ